MTQMVRLILHCWWVDPGSQLSLGESRPGVWWRVGPWGTGESSLPSEDVEMHIILQHFIGTYVILCRHEYLFIYNNIHFVILCKVHRFIYVRANTYIHVHLIIYVHATSPSLWSFHVWKTTGPWGIVAPAPWSAGPTRSLGMTWRFPNWDRGEKTWKFQVVMGILIVIWLTSWDSDWESMVGIMGIVIGIRLVSYYHPQGWGICRKGESNTAKAQRLIKITRNLVLRFIVIASKEQDPLFDPHFLLVPTLVEQISSQLWWNKYPV